MKKEYYNIISEILKKERFINLKDEAHHGINRMVHSLNVSKTAYYISKKLGLKNYKKITKAALLHDYFLDTEIEGVSLFTHSKVAAHNAIKDFNITHREYNAIEAHMFPFSIKHPMYLDSWIVNISDKLVSLYEVARYKVPFKLGTTFIFILNFMVSPIIR